MRTFLILVLLVMVSGCATIDKYATDENKQKLEELFEKYNTPENRDKLKEAIEKLMDEMK